MIVNQSAMQVTHQMRFPIKGSIFHYGNAVRQSLCSAASCRSSP